MASHSSKQLLKENFWKQLSGVCTVIRYNEHLCHMTWMRRIATALPWLAELVILTLQISITGFRLRSTSGMLIVSLRITLGLFSTNMILAMTSPLFSPVPDTSAGGRTQGDPIWFFNQFLCHFNGVHQMQHRFDLDSITHLLIVLNLTVETAAEPITTSTWQRCFSFNRQTVHTLLRDIDHTALHAQDVVNEFKRSC